MDYIVFCEEIKKKIAEKTGYKTKIIDVLKNNNLTLKAISILEESSNMSPQIYMENFYDRYLNNVSGIDLDDIAESVIAFYKKYKIDSIKSDYFYNFEDLKDDVHYKIINADRNKKLLKSVPHEKFLDLAKVYIVNIKLPDSSIGTVLVNDNMMNIWKVDTADLEEAASKNLEKEDVVFQNIADMVSSIVLENNIEGFDMDDIDDNVFMYVLTNMDKCFGVRLLLRKNLLQNIAKKLDSDLIILPSSLHEALILKERYKNDVENLRKMVMEVNDSVVDMQDFLSDNIYFYNRIENRLEIL